MRRVSRRELPDDEGNLLLEAEEAMRRAVAPFTGISVGSAVSTGRDVYQGCNVESAISGLGVCAERNAINHAVIHEGGGIKVGKMAVVWDRREPARPCGACLQYLSEFANEDVKILMADTEASHVDVAYLREMLPHHYAL